MKKNLLSIVLVASVLCAQAQNILVNPGFEKWASGAPIGWTISQPTYVSQSTSNFNEGVKACQIANSGTDFFYISQSNPVEAGKTYRLSFSYYVSVGDNTDISISSCFLNSSDTPIKLTDDSLSLKGPNGEGKYFTSNKGNWVTYTCDVLAPSNAAKFFLNLKTASGSTVLLDNFSFAVYTLPSLYCTPTAITSLNYVMDNGPSAIKSFSVKAFNVASAGSVTVVAPTNFEISFSNGTDFRGTSSLQIAEVNGYVSPTNIYVRLKSGLAVGTYSGKAIVSTALATASNISLSGAVSNPPVTINSSVTTLTGFTYNETKGPSDQKSFTVSGINIPATGIVVTAPANFEISQLGGSSFSSTSSITLDPTSGSVPTTTLYVRMKSDLAQGPYSGTLKLTAGTTVKNISLTGIVAQNADITVSTMSISGFDYPVDKGPSDIMSFVVSGTGITSSFYVIAPSNFKISTDSASFLGTTQLMIPYVNGVANPTKVYVRMTAGLPVDNYTGNLEIFSNGTVAKIITLSGSVTLLNALNQTHENILQAYSAGNEIVIKGSERGEVVSVYNTLGVQVASVRSNGETLYIPVKKGLMYIVRSTSSKAIKVSH